MREGRHPGEPVKVKVPRVLKKGYVGKTKGVFQILFERGFIDPNPKTWADYAMDKIDQET